MKKVISFFSFATCMALVLFCSCNLKDEKSETASTDVVVPDTTATQTMMPDTTGMVNMDTAKNAATMTKNSSAKIKKGKVSSIMMTESNSSTPMNKDQSGYYSSVEVLPMYPGGQDALNDFVARNIEYPETATENGIEAVVTVNFAVDERGKVSNPKIIGRPVGYGLEEEVLKAVSKMPTWTPGAIKGKNVKTYYTLPVNFKMEN